MTKKLYSVLGNSQKLDGGAMFGNVPKAMWENWVSVDEQNRIELSCRALLVKEDHRTILFEAGIGAFFEPKLKQRFGIVESEHVLLDNLKKLGLNHQDIDIVVLSHLHFDHVGGLLSQWEEGKTPQLLFPNAQFIVGKSHWERALTPHFRDRASFVETLNQQMLASGRLHLVETETIPMLGPDYCFHFSHGHTPGLMLSEINTDKGPVVFAADLIPGVPWIHLPVTMGYDRYPEQLIDEKHKLLTDLQARNGWLFLTHDCVTTACQIARNEKGKFSAINLQQEWVEF